MADFTPTPTEYKGTIFRSKSEAIFARTLDLAGWKFVYEPKYYPDTCGHCWDFYMSKLDPFESIYVEYKPSEPTLTYVESLKKKTRQYWLDKAQKFVDQFNSIKDKEIQFQTLHCGIECPRYLLFYGSPFNTTRTGNAYQPFPIWDPKTKHGVLFNQECDNGNNFLYSSYHDPASFGITDEIIEKAKSYRFDLKHN